MQTRLRQERQKNGWTQQYVADKVGITKAALHNIEVGKRKPSYDVLVKLIEIFGIVDPRELFAPIPKSLQR